MQYPSVTTIGLPRIPRYVACRKLLKSVCSDYRQGAPIDAPIAVAAVVSTAEISLEDIRAVKHLADRIGVEKVKELAAVRA